MEIKNKEEGEEERDALERECERSKIDWH